MAKIIKTRVSNSNPLVRNPFRGDKRPGIEPAIHFYKVEYCNPCQNWQIPWGYYEKFKKLTFPVIRYY